VLRGRAGSDIIKWRCPELLPTLQGGHRLYPCEKAKDALLTWNLKKQFLPAISVLRQDTFQSSNWHLSS
jgi:hypothetical protein